MALFPFDSIGHAFRSLVSDCLTIGKETSPRGIKTMELIAPRIEIIDPRKRWLISKTRKVDPIYGIGELFWYLSGTNKLLPIEYYAPSIKKYSDNGNTLNSAYGYRIYNKWFDQWQFVIQHLKNKLTWCIRKRNILAES